MQILINMETALDDAMLAILEGLFYCFAYKKSGQ